MDDHHHYHLAHGTRPRMEFPSRMPLPPPGHSQRQGHIPCSSSQFQAPPPPAHAAFQSHRSTEAAYNQSSVAFHSHSYPPPTDFSCPPPSFHQNYGNDPSGSISDVQHQGERVPPYQDYGMPPCQNYGFSATVSTPLDIRSQPALEAPENFGGGSHVKLDSCHMRSTPGAFSLSEDACKSKEEDDQTWLNNFEQRILERRGPQNESITAKKKPLKANRRHLHRQTHANGWTAGSRHRIRPPLRGRGQENRVARCPISDLKTFLCQMMTREECYNDAPPMYPGANPEKNNECQSKKVTNTPLYDGAKSRRKSCS